MSHEEYLEIYCMQISYSSGTQASQNNGQLPLQTTNMSFTTPTEALGTGTSTSAGHGGHTPVLFKATALSVPHRIGTHGSDKAWVRYYVVAAPSSESLCLHE